MIFKTKEEKEQAFSKATLKDGYWNLECFDSSENFDVNLWILVNYNYRPSDIIQKNDMHVRFIELNG